MRKESKFRQQCCQNSIKKYERGKINNVMGGVRKNLNFDNEITKIFATQNSCPGEVLEGGVVEREKMNCGNQVAEIVGE